jgi:hypothetical protein
MREVALLQIEGEGLDAADEEYGVVIDVSDARVIKDALDRVDNFEAF